MPGCVETQGVGEPGISKPWDCHWDCSPKPLKDVDEKDLLIVCEGGFGCRCNLAVRRHGQAKEILVRGLDVCADLPEAKALLDGLLDVAAMP